MKVVVWTSVPFLVLLFGVLLLLLFGIYWCIMCLYLYIICSLEYRIICLCHSVLLFQSVTGTG